MNKQATITDRDREIISLVASALGLSSVVTENEPSKEDILLLVNEVANKQWDKYGFHTFNVAARSFFRAASKVNKNVYDHIPYNLKSVFPEFFSNAGGSFNRMNFFVEVEQ